MAEDYTLTLKISVNKGLQANLIIEEQTLFSGISFKEMTHISAQYYDMVTKIQKARD